MQAEIAIMLFLSTCKYEFCVHTSAPLCELVHVRCVRARACASAPCAFAHLSVFIRVEEAEIDVARKKEVDAPTQ